MISDEVEWGKCISLLLLSSCSPFDYIPTYELIKKDWPDVSRMSGLTERFSVSPFLLGVHSF